ncbi:creatininase [Methylobacterium sp. Leaf399]|uniref:creatininase family protein n=1 Tax=unclassified Methylobacterium TaxID=2615210 RepID=UPI0007006DD2|nr:MULTISPECIES: creatininase family protein [unclassified Methylobacterium]KQT07903.1 creatininase [Methylobacterium sp. Leaf399]KQT89016.1 creatininase [Methylobacterium sp. Leaf466]
MTAPLLWAERTWDELPGDLAAVGGAAILPVGATEQHGPHLGTGMDFVLAEMLAHAVSAATRVPVLPTLPYGCSLGHSRRWPGTITLDPLVMTQLVVQVGTGAHRSGVRRLFLVNAHVTNAAPLRCALEMLRAAHDDLMVALVNSATVSERVRAAHVADADDWHANAAETALMMALAPRLVRPDRVADADDPDRTQGLVFAHPVNRTSRNGVTGRPSQATATEGGRLFAWMVEDLTALVMRGLTETPPLPHPYDVSV